MKAKTPELEARTPTYSKTIMTELVLPQHTNDMGGIFGGVVMSWIDIAAAIAAKRHSGKVCVTASIDELHFLAPIKKGYIVNIESQVTSVHRTSCEVMVDVSAEDPVTSENFHTTHAFLTFVALDNSGRPTPMRPLKLETDEERKYAAAALIRKAHREKLKKRLEG